MEFRSPYDADSSTTGSQVWFTKPQPIFSASSIYIQTINMEAPNKHSPAITRMKSKEQYVQNGTINIFIKSPFVQISCNLLWIGNTCILMSDSCNQELCMKLVKLIDSDYENQRYTLVLQNVITDQIFKIDLECILENRDCKWQLLDFENFKKIIEKLVVKAYCEGK